MKTSLFTSIQLSTLLCTILLSTMLVMPLVPAVRYDAGGATAVRVAQVWVRSPYAPAKVGPRRELRLPQSEAPVSEPATKPAPIDQSGPDAAMIKPGRVRAKTIKL